MIHIVTSSDGVQFAVDSAEKSIAADARFAAHLSAAQLDLHGDFTRVVGLIADFNDCIADLTAASYDVAAFNLKFPRVAGPLERRAAFRVIKGGKL
jgi:hypothetical protein